MINHSAPCAAAEMGQDDLSLVRAYREGDAAAFEALVKRYDRMLFRIAQHITQNREDAKDAVQEGFLKVFRELSQFEENSRFSTRLIRSTVSESLMRLRKQRPTTGVSLDEDFQSVDGTPPFEVADWAPNPEERYTRSEFRDTLRNALQELPETRVVFVLRDIERLSSEATADVLELSNCRSQIAIVAGSAAGARTAEQVLRKAS